MGRYSRGPGQASQFAAVWDRLPKPEQERILDEVRVALRAVDGEVPDPQCGKPKTAPRRHIRFERGEVRELQVMNSARRAAVDDAWGRLARSAAEIQRDRRSR